MARLVYRSGSAREDNLTPRPGKDTIEKAGQSPGLSTFTKLELAVLPGEKAQILDLDLLGGPLRAYDDQPGLEGAIEGHVSIAPALPDGTINYELLAEWSATRNSGKVHPLTELIKNTLVDTIKRSR
jgi:hypothetical protein